MKRTNFLANINVIIILALFASLPVFCQEPEEGNATDLQKLSGSGTKKSADAVLVSVNGDAITLLDVLFETGSKERELASIFSGERLYAETLNLRKQTVEDLIDAKLIYAKYLERPFPIPNQEIENIIDNMVLDTGCTDREDLEKKMALIGVTKEQMRMKAKERIAVSALMAYFCDKTVYITPKAVYEEYENNKSGWTSPARVGMQMIQILKSNSRNANAEETVKILEEKLKNAGELTFREAAYDYSDAFSAEKGGDTGIIKVTDLRPEFRDALRGKVTGDIAGPVETPEAYYFLRVSGLIRSTTIPFSQAAPEIKKRLHQRELIKARKEFRNKLRERAVIKYFF